MFLNFENNNILRKVEWLLISVFLLIFFVYSSNNLIVEEYSRFVFPGIALFVAVYLITNYSKFLLISILYGIGLFLNYKYPMLSGEHHYIVNITYLFYLINIFFDDELFFQMNIVYVGLIYQVSFIRHLIDYEWVSGSGLYNYLSNPIYSDKIVHNGFAITTLNYFILIFELCYLGLLFTKYNKIAIGLALLLHVSCLYFLENYVYHIFLLLFNLLLYSEEDL